MDYIPFREFVDIQNIIDGRKTPQLHIEMCDWLEHTQKNPRRILQVFRYAGKSHITCLYVVWRLLSSFSIIFARGITTSNPSNSLITVVTIKKNNNIKTISGKDAVEMPGEPPFDFLLNLLIVSYIFRFCF